MVVEIFGKRLDLVYNKLGVIKTKNDQYFVRVTETEYYWIDPRVVKGSGLFKMTCPSIYFLLESKRMK